MRDHSYTRAALVLALTILSTFPARSDVPSTLCGQEGCDYLVRSGSGTYPDEKERINWDCFDARTKVSIACTYVRGDDIRKYSDVYRRKSTPSDSAQKQYCLAGCKYLPDPDACRRNCARLK